MIQDILIAIWFFTPAAAANLAPVIVAKGNRLASLNKPLDGGKTWRGKRIFGDNKTWRGMIVGIAAATAIFYAQQLAIQSTPALASYFSQVDYLSLPTMLMGLLFGVGALGGDAVESFFKRLRGIEPGHAWVPFDQIDFIIGSILLTAPIVMLTWPQYLWALAIGCGLHMLTSYLGYLTGYKQRPI